MCRVSKDGVPETYVPKEKDTERKKIGREPTKNESEIQSRVYNQKVSCEKTVDRGWGQRRGYGNREVPLD